MAARVAWERNVPLGKEVGYQIRFEDRSSLGTRICFITEGILLRWLQDDPKLFDIGAIFSVFTAAFVLFHALTADGTWVSRCVQGDNQ